MKWTIFFFLFKLRQCFVATEKLEYWCQPEWFFFSLIKPSMILLYCLENQAIRNYGQEKNPTIGSGVKGTAEKLQCRLINEYRFFFFLIRLLWLSGTNKSYVGEESKQIMSIFAEEGPVHPFQKVTAWYSLWMHLWQRLF